MKAADLRTAALLAAALFLVYNSNGREIGNFDSQPTKYAARELLLRGAPGLGHVVGAMPELATRPAFVLARDGQYRSAYSPVPAVIAAAIAWPLWAIGAIDIRAPLAPSLIAALAASLLTAASAALVYLMARRRLTTGRALGVSIAFAVGTGLWPTVSQTLWQHETTIFGLMVAVYAFTRDEIRLRDAAVIGVGLALAGSSRVQVAPAIAIMMMATFARGGRGAGALTTTVVGIAAGAMMFINLRWFGTPIGAGPLLEALHDAHHSLSYSFAFSFSGLAGLALSPSRGLLVFSPVVLVAVAGARAGLQGSWTNPLRWCVIAAAVQYLFYGSYSVWWGGHTYGPRYALDILPFLAPLGVEGMARLHHPALKTLAVVALAWSIIVSATGAFVYPHERWNTSPASVDRFHERLWDWSDSQIVRSWQSGPSPQNLSLFSRDAVRADP